MAGLYAKAIERRQNGRAFPGLGEVIGVDTPFEADPGAECVIDAAHLNVEEARDAALSFLAGWLGDETLQPGQSA